MSTSSFTVPHTKSQILEVNYLTIELKIVYISQTWLPCLLKILENPYRNRQGLCRSMKSLKVLKFEVSFQGPLKLLENENLSLKIDQTPWNL